MKLRELYYRYVLPNISSHGEFLPLDEIAAIYVVSRRTVKRWIDHKWVRAYRKGAAWYVNWFDAERQYLKTGKISRARRRRAEGASDATGI